MLKMLHYHNKSMVTFQYKHRYVLQDINSESLNTNIHTYNTYRWSLDHALHVVSYTNKTDIHRSTQYNIQY